MDNSIKNIVVDFNENNTSIGYFHIAKTFGVSIEDLLRILNVNYVVNENGSIKVIVKIKEYTLIYVEIALNIWIKSIKNKDNKVDYIEYSDGEIMNHENKLTTELAQSMLRHPLIKYW